MFTALYTKLKSLVPPSARQRAYQSSFVPLAESEGRLGELYQQNASLGQYLNTLFEIAIVIAAILAVVMVTIAGFRYMTAVSEGALKASKEQFRNAIVGLLLLLSAFVLLQQINPQLLDLNFSVDRSTSQENRQQSDTGAFGQ